MPKSLIIQTIVGFIICMIALTLFVFSIIRLTLSTEYHQIATDGTITITPAPDRTYFITVESSYELTNNELKHIYKSLIVTSDDPLGGFWLSDAPGAYRSSSMNTNTSTHRASVSELGFVDNDPITLNIRSTHAGPDRTLMIKSGDELTVIGIIIPFTLLLISLGAGLAAGLRLFIWTKKKLTCSNPPPAPSAPA